MKCFAKRLQKNGWAINYTPKHNAWLHNHWRRMDFIDRQEELRRLRRLSTSGRSGFAVVYGRRRIGKSHLLMKWSKEVGGLYTVGDTSMPALQRQALAGAIASRFPGFDEVLYPTWKALLNALSMRARVENWHGPVIFDEFPYYVASDDTLPGVFQAWIDSELNQDGLLVVVSGSSQHMMQGLALDSDSPLYGRAQEIMHLAPISVGYMKDALGISNVHETIKAYSIWGGVPRYWSSAEDYGDSLDECVDDLVLNPLGLFHEEPNFLLQTESPSAIGLRPYLDAIGYGAHRVSEIASRMQQPSTALARPMARLIGLDLVKREVPFGESERDSKKSLYSIADQFCHFWFQVVAPRRSFFESSNKSGRIFLWRKYAEGIFAYQWESLVRRTVHLAEKVRNLLSDDDLWFPAGRWWKDNHAEWDILSTNYQKNVALLGEVKWSERPFSSREVEQLVHDLFAREQPTGLPQRRLFVLAFPSVMNDVKVPDGVCLLTGEDIFKATLE